VNVSLSSSTRSPFTGTFIGSDVSPGSNVSVPLDDWKSVPDVA
jgi:hypothetical protein